MKWFRKFMMGRYGIIDELGKLIFGMGILFTLLTIFFSSRVLNFISLFFSIIFLYRILSKDVSQRYGENARFLRSWNQAKREAMKRTKKLRGLKDYRYFKCVNCGQELRVPRGKGKIEITCPKCHTRMIKKS